MKRVLRICFLAILLIGIGTGLFQLYKIWKLNQQAKEDERWIRSYSPYEEETGTHDLAKLEAAMAQNEDVCGWIVIPGTNIDYPILQGEDNEYYLTHNMFHERRVYGSIFLDYRCEPDFGGFNNIIYGHHMNAGNMFSQLLKFKQKAFWESHPTAWLYTANQIYQIEFFAYYWTAPDAVFYQTGFVSPAEQERYLERIRRKAVYLRDIPMNPTADRMVTLSTCSYELKDTRTILHGKLTPVYE